LPQGAGLEKKGEGVLRAVTVLLRQDKKTQGQIVKKSDEEDQGLYMEREPGIRDPW